MLQAAALTERMHLELYLCPFNAYTQELLNPNSNLAAFRPHLTILTVLTQDIAPELLTGFGGLSGEQVEQVIQRVTSELELLLQSFREHVSGQLVVQTFDYPDNPAMGIADPTLECGQRDSISRINQVIRHNSIHHPSISVVVTDELIRKTGSERWYDPVRGETAGLPFQHEAMTRICQSWLRFVVASCGPVRKVLVCDLDNTLWNGIVGEDGADGISMGRTPPGIPHRRLQQVICDLHHRGVLLAVCSKNNWDDAWSVIESHPDMLLRPRQFSAVRINWEPKDTNLLSIAEELNVGLDSLVFLDDNPQEQLLIQQSLPEVRVIDAESDPFNYARLLLDDVSFERLRITDEDRRRGQMYSSQRERKELRQTVGNLETWLHSLETTVQRAANNTSVLARISQLTQKTNQFNLTNRRYQVAELEQFLTSGHWKILGYRVSDRFGDNGLVGVALLRFAGDVCEIDSFLMSCRVIGRGIEQAMLADICQLAATEGVHKLSGLYSKTPRNSLCEDFLENHGFHWDESRWILESSLFSERSVPSWIKLVIDDEQPVDLVDPSADGR